MKLFYSIFKCFKKHLKIDNVEYHVICGEKYTTDGEIYLGNCIENNDMYPDSLDPLTPLYLLTQRTEEHQEWSNPGSS